METKVLNGISVSWSEKFEKKCLRIAINGHFTEEDAKEAVSKWKAEFNNVPEDEKINVICNCGNMSGYDSEARKIYQQTIGELKSKIGYFWIVTNNKIFKTAAMTMGLLTKLKIKTANTESDIICE